MVNLLNLNSEFRELFGQLLEREREQQWQLRNELELSEQLEQNLFLLRICLLFSFR